MIFRNRRLILKGLSSSLFVLQQGLKRGWASSQRKSESPAWLAKNRNLFNGDCNVYFYNPELLQPEGPPYSAKAIHNYVDLLADSGIDTFLINPNTQIVWYPSKKLETALSGYRRGDREFLRSRAPRLHLSPELEKRYFEEMEKLLGLMLDLVEAGVDWLAETSKACRRRGISPWLSFRMNDTHSGGDPDSSFNCKLFRQARYRLSGRVPGPGTRREPTWIGLNYAYPEVRNYMFDIIHEPVETYDFEGIELDWLRHPVCCEPIASQTQTYALTSWIGDIRALAKRQSKRLGKPYPLGLRIPANLEYMKSIGIDVRALARRGLIDFVSFSNFWQTSWDMPYDLLRLELGPDVALYGVMEDSPNWLETLAPGLQGESSYQKMQLAGDEAYGSRKQATEGATSKNFRGTRYLSASGELMRGNAAGKLAMGVAGIEQYNFFVTDQVKVAGQRANYGALLRLHDLEYLRGKPKHYTLSTPSGRATAYWDLPEQVPASVDPGQRRPFRISMCSEPSGAGLRLVVQVVIERLPSSPDLEVSLNGIWPVFKKDETDALLFPAGPYTKHVLEHQAFNYTLDTSPIRDGWNELVVIHTGSSSSRAPVRIVSLELAVKS